MIIFVTISSGHANSFHFLGKERMIVFSTLALLLVSGFFFLQ